jgi:hypothetical protein
MRSSAISIASVPSRLNGANFFSERRAAANPNSVRRCQPKTAPFSVAICRANSLAASSVAPMIKSSSVGALLSSQSHARRIRRRLTTEVATVALTQRDAISPLFDQQSYDHGPRRLLNLDALAVLEPTETLARNLDQSASDPKRIGYRLPFR